MTDTIEQAQQFLLTGDFSASLAMYNRIYNDSDSDETEAPPLPCCPICMDAV